MTQPRLLLVALVLTAVVAAGATVVTVLARDPAPPVAVVTPRAAPVGPAVLRSWDARRAAAWARADVAGLQALYVPGSVAGRRDVAMLRAWAARGLRVRGMRMQVLAVDVVHRRSGRLVLTVTDRLARAVAVGHGVRRALPRDVPSSRTVTLVRQAETWRVAAVRPGAQPAR